MTVLTAQAMEDRIRAYFDACNRASAEDIASHFVPDAVHYFPDGAPGGPFRGATTIARRWVDAVAQLGSAWTVDHVIADPATARAVIEWTHFKTKVGVTLRGDEWYRFDPESGLIREIRAYYAVPQPSTGELFQLGGFDYVERAYPLKCPVPR